MKNPKKPTRQQRKLIQAMGLNTENWLVIKDTSTELHLVHKFSDKNTRVIHKELRA